MNSNRRWLVCLGCALIMFCTSGLSVNAFTVYQPYLLKLNNLTNTQSSALIMLRNLFSFAAMLLTGRYYKALSYRFGLSLAGLICALSYVCFALSRSFIAYCASAAVMGIAHGFGTMIPITIIISSWFASKRALALSLCSSITGVSTLGIPSLITYLVEKYSLRFSFLCEAVVVALCAAIACLLIRNAPKAADNTCAHSVPAQAERPVPKRMWLLLAPMTVLLGAMTSVGYSHLSLVMMSSGFDSGVIAMGIMISGLAMTAGKLAYGAVSEKFSLYTGNSIFGCAALAGIALICLNCGNTLIIYVAMLLYGGGLAFTTVGLSAWCGELCSGSTYESTVRRFQLGYSAGSLLFSFLPGLLADVFCGSYIPAYIFFFFCCVFVLGSIQYALKRSPIR